MADTQDMETIIFNIISYGGNAKALAYEALESARDSDYKKAEELLLEADDNLKSAHKTQTNLISEEAAGNKKEVSLLMVHAQDHLMSAIEAKTLIEYLIEMYKKINI